jgi:biotin operon repressor
MIYQRSQEIEQRLTDVLRLVRTGRYSTPRLAEKLGVSVPTISRCIESLRFRGYSIRSVKKRKSWTYVLEATAGVRSSRCASRPRFTESKR